MIRSSALRTNDLKSGFSRLTKHLNIGNKSLIALMTPHFSKDQVSDVLKDLSTNTIIGGMVDGIHGYMGPCISLSIVDDATMFEIPHGVFQSRDKSVGRWMKNHQNSNRLRSGGFNLNDGSDAIKHSLNDLSNSWLSHLPNKRKTFLFLAEKSSSHEFCQLLDAIYPNDSKMGLIATPMFFKSGDPACLFTSPSKVSGGGVVGYALNSRRIDMDFLNLNQFSPVLSVADCRGNVLLKWEGADVSFDDLKDALYVQLLDFEMVSQRNF